MRFCVKNGFGAEKSEFSEKVQKSEKRVLKHLKKHWFYKGLSDGAGNVFSETEKCTFSQKTALFRQKRKFPQCCALFAKSAQNRFWGVRNSVHPLKQMPNQHSWEVTFCEK